MITTPSQSWLAVAIVFIAVTIVAECLARAVPAYREELRVEADTRMLSLDGLRGILCFAVLLHHAAMTQTALRTHEWVPPAATLFVHLGRSAVALFFCITGFLFWGRALRTNGRFAIGEFFRGRLFRVMPLYWFSALVVAAVIAPTLLGLRPSLGQLAKLAVQLAAGGVLPWGPVSTARGVVFPESVNAGVHWSLRYEWLFYVALPVLGFVFARRNWTIALLFVLSAALLTVNSIVGRDDLTHPRLRLPGALPYLTMFPIGMAAAHAVRRFRLATEFRKTRYAAVVVLAAGALLALSLPRFGLTTSPTSFVSHLCILLIFIPVACGNTLFGLLTLRPLRLMGTVSYSVYLLHGIVLFLSRPILARVLHAPSDLNLAYWLVIAGVGVVTLIVASLTYLAIERPFIRLDRKLRPRPARDLSPAIPPTATV